MGERKSIPALLGAYMRAKELAPGARLPPERELAASLGISRPALRETIKQLSRFGVLHARQGSGTFVSLVHLTDLLEVRLALEPLAAAHAAKRRSDDEAARLEDLVRRLVARVDDVVAFPKVDRDIHTTVAVASRNRVMEHLLAGLGEAADLSRSRTTLSVELRTKTVEDLSRLVRHVRERDSESAADAMRTHLESVRAALTA